MKKNILLTGGAGYIGSHVCIELIKKGYQVVIIDNFSNSSLSVMNSIKKITGYQPTFYETDVRDKFYVACRIGYCILQLF